MFINEDTSTQQITHIYFTKLIPTKHIEIHILYPTTTTTTSATTFIIALQPLNQHIITYKPFSSNTMLLVSKTSITLVLDILTQSSTQITMQYTFVKDVSISVSDIKLLQLSSHIYAILNGRSILILTHHNNNNTLSIKQYYSPYFLFCKILTYSIKQQLNGVNIYINSLVKYTTTNTNSGSNNNNCICFQQLMLPYLEQELILLYDVKCVNINPKDTFFITNDIIVYKANNTLIFKYLVNENNTNASDVILNFNETIDAVKVITKDKFLLFAQNSHVYLCVISLGKALLSQAIMYNPNYNSEIIIKWKCYNINNNNNNRIWLCYVNNSFAITSAIMDYTNKPSLTLTNPTKTHANIVYDSISCKHKITSTQYDVDIISYHINSKHTLFRFAKQRLLFYNTIITYFKQNTHSLIFFANNSNTFYIYTPATPPKHTFTLSFTSTPYYIIDFYLYENIFFYIIVHDKHEHNYKLIQTQMISNTKERIVYQTETPFHLIQSITNINTNDYIAVISLYGDITFFKVDVYGSCDYCGNFAYTFDNTEITDINTVIKTNINEVYITNDKMKLFTKYNYIQTHMIDCGSTGEFTYNGIVFTFDRGYVCFVVMMNTFTYVDKIIQCNTITINDNNANAITTNNTLKFNVDTFTFTYNNNI